MSAIETAAPVIEHSPERAYQWSAERAAAWFEKNGWIAGCNYIPAYAINQLEMWQAETFDLTEIDKELSWAASLGFNTVRVFLHHLLWEQDRVGFRYRIDQFLDVANKYGIKTMLVLFDAVWDPNPKLGKQPEPKMNIHNSGWVQSPGFDVLNDVTRYDELRDYVQGIVQYFKNDERVLIWDLFNEPDNMNLASYKDDFYALHKAELSLQLLKKTINWVRVIDPIQPITAAPWQWVDMNNLSRIDQFMFTHSDIVSFHCYEPKDKLEERIISLKQFGRPLLCTEYMARPFECTFQDVLPVLKKHNVGAYSWGLVSGKTQTHCAWDSWQKPAHPELWFHDIFHADGTPYDSEEVEFLKEITKKEVAETFQQVA